MKKCSVFLFLFALSVVCGAVSAAEFKSDICRFSFPAGFEVRNSDQGALFEASGEQESVVFFHLPVEQDIDRGECLALPDSRWFRAVQQYEVVDKNKPWFSRYDKYTVYRKPDGSFVKIYRYVCTRQIGFLVVNSPSNEWTVADEVAASCRGFRTLWEQVVFGWKWIVLAVIMIGVVFFLREKVRSRQFWKKIAIWAVISGAAYGLGMFFLAKHLTLLLLLIGVGFLFVLGSGDDDSSDNSDDGGSSSGYDGAGHVFDNNI